MSHECHQPCGLRVSLEKTEVFVDVTQVSPAMWTESKSREDGGVLGRAPNKRNRTNETALYTWVERFAGSTETETGGMHRGKWKG